MTPPPDVIVIGAGVAGLCTALHLQRGGRQVAVIDPLPPAGGASFGNAGMISADTATPIAMPGMLRRVPGWLSDPMGPLAVRPAYFPRALPWLLRWVRAGRRDRVMAIAAAMRALHRPAFAGWRELLGPDLYADLIRPVGQISLWDDAEESPGAALEREIRERHGIAAQVLAPEELRQMVPGIAPGVKRALFVPGNGFTVSPARLVRTLGALFQQEGGMLLAERAMKLIPREGGGFTVMTNAANHPAQAVVVAAGAWSNTLLAPLGLRLPLETERGYHAMLPEPSVLPRHTLSYKSRGFGLTPMEGGLRVAGTVEFAGLDAPPDERRAELLAAQARRLFPGLTHGTPSLWMGFRPSTPDSLPILGTAPGRPGLFLAFGHGHYGMTGGPASGRIVARMVLGERPDTPDGPIDAAPYAAARFRGM